LPHETTDKGSSVALQTSKLEGSSVHTKEKWFQSDSIDGTASENTQTIVEKRGPGGQGLGGFHRGMCYVVIKE
jgi:hypothetical protein